MSLRDALYIDEILYLYVCMLCACVSVLQVKILYVRNLMLRTKESTIKILFSLIAPVKRVKKIIDYAFVHFHSKEDAHEVMNVFNGKEYHIVVLARGVVRYVVNCTRIHIRIV